MNKVREYKDRAEECLEMALRSKSPEVRAHYEQIATMWLKLAQTRLGNFDKQPALQQNGDTSDERAPVN